MTRLLFFCHGNICRSPMAEAIFVEMAKHAGRQADFTVASAATSAEELGHNVYPAARRVLIAHGIPCPDHRAVQLSATDYEQYDRLIGMKEYNLKHALARLGGDPRHKLYRLLPDRDVADPWYSGDFETAFRDIEEGCHQLLQSL